MKTSLILILCLLFSSCAITEPIRKPVGTGMLVAGGALVEVVGTPIEKIQQIDIAPVAKTPLYILAYPIAIVGGTVGFGMFVGGVILYPEIMN